MTSQTNETSRGDLKTHAALFDRMAETVGLDLQEEAISGRLRFDEISEAVLRCTRCGGARGPRRPTSAATATCWPICMRMRPRGTSRAWLFRMIWAKPKERHHAPLTQSAQEILICTPWATRCIICA